MNKEMSKDSIFSREKYQDNLTTALRRHIGRDGAFTKYKFADLVDVKDRTLESHLQGESMPYSHVLFNYMAVLPIEFANEILAPLNLSVQRNEPQHVSDNTALRLSANTAFEFAKALEDGKIDCKEMEALKPIVREVVSTLNDWLNK